MLLITRNEVLGAAALALSSAITLVLCLIAVGMLVRQWRAAAAPERRSLVPLGPALPLTAADDNEQDVSNHRKGRRRLALLEGAIVVPVPFTLIFGVLEFSYYFYQQHLVATGVRDAARYLARVQDPNNGTAQAIAQRLAATGSPTPGSSNRVAGFDPAEVPIAVTPVANVADGVCGAGPLPRK